MQFLSSVRIIIIIIMVANISRVREKREELIEDAKNANDTFILTRQWMEISTLIFSRFSCLQITMEIE